MNGLHHLSEPIFLDKNLRFLRRTLGWSQEELAVRVGLNRGNIASYENGSAEPKINNLSKIALLFGVSLHDLTHKDLGQHAIQVQNAPHNGHAMLCMAPQALHEYEQRAQELQDVMKGLRTCCQFKLRNIEEASINDLQIVAMHFEELFNAAQALMQEHLSLLGALNKKEQE